MKKIFLNLYIKINKNRLWIFVLALFLLHLFLRFYQLESRMIFGWDQVDSAWAAKAIIVDHKFPLVGTQAKLNSGIFVGPLYFYLISIVYFLTNLDPIASGIFAGLTSIFSFWILFYIVKKLFSETTAIMAIFINTVAFLEISFDRIQWTIDFIPAISLLIFYSLYKIITGYPKYAILLAVSLGFSFHIHFTSIFYPIIIALVLPFFPKTKQMLKYALFSILIFFIWLTPNIIAFSNNTQHASSLFNYTNTYYHGLHLTRVIQLSNDALIQFEKFFSFSGFEIIKFILIPLFLIAYLYKKRSRKRLLLCYLIILWFLVPWIVFSTYSGEISDYYFSINKFIALFIIANLLGKLFSIRNLVLRMVLILLLAYYGLSNINEYFLSKSVGLGDYRQKVLKSIRESKKIEFVQGDPSSYLYYIYTRNYK